MKNKYLLFHGILKKKWTAGDIMTLVGSHHGTYTAYSLSDRIRYGAATGGTTTAILAHALENGLIDGALVCRSRVFERDKIRAEFYIATTCDDLYASQDSKYVQSDFVPQATRLIDDFEGNLAVVGLPCDLNILRRRMKRSSHLAKKIVFCIGLFCGHNSQPQLIDNVIQNMHPDDGSRLNYFRFRTGLWRGNSIAKFDDKILEKKSSYYNLYQNLYFFCQPKCLRCHDHFAYHADISIGDIWSYHLKNENIKYNAVIAKTQTGARVLETANQARAIYLADVPIDDILDGQTRGAPTHNNTSAKSKAGKRFGLHIPDKHHRNVKWHEFLVAWIILFNYTWSRNQKYAKLIFTMPRKVLKAYLLFLKGLESLK